jgi:hypothetical protein
MTTAMFIGIASGVIIVAAIFFSMGYMKGSVDMKKTLTKPNYKS